MSQVTGTPFVVSRSQAIEILTTRGTALNASKHYAPDGLDFSRRNQWDFLTMRSKGRCPEAI